MYVAAILFGFRQQFPTQPMHCVVFLLLCPPEPTDHRTDLFTQSFGRIETGHCEGRNCLGTSFDEDIFSHLGLVIFPAILVFSVIFCLSSIQTLASGHDPHRPEDQGTFQILLLPGYSRCPAPLSSACV